MGNNFFCQCMGLRRLLWAVGQSQLVLLLRLRSSPLRCYVKLLNRIMQTLLSLSASPSSSAFLRGSLVSIFPLPMGSPLILLFLAAAHRLKLRYKQDPLGRLYCNCSGFHSIHIGSTADYHYIVHIVSVFCLIFDLLTRAFHCGTLVNINITISISISIMGHHHHQKCLGLPAPANCMFMLYVNHFCCLYFYGWLLSYWTFLPCFSLSGWLSFIHWAWLLSFSQHATH